MSSKHTYNLKLLVILVAVTEIIFWPVAISIWYYLDENVKEFRLENEKILLGLFFIPVIIALYLYKVYWKNRALKKYGDPSLVSSFSVKVSNIHSWLHYFFIRNAFAMLIIALANPQYGKNMKEAKVSGIDIMIALDVSNSMMAEDMAGSWNRLKIAQISIEKMMQKLRGDRIGLVVFAGDAYTQVPVTDDYAAAKQILAGVSTGMVSAQGTAIGKAIDTCMAGFDFEEMTNRAIIVISDGENHEDDGISAAKRAIEKNVPVYTVGVGSVTGSPIPEYNGDKKQGVKRDKDGNTVITRLNEQMLKDIADNGGGTYVKATASDLGLDKLLAEINKIEKTEHKKELYMDYDDQFYHFVFLAFVFLMCEMLIIEWRNASIEHLFDTV